MENKTTETETMTCNSCCRSVYSPFRVYEGSKIVSGCVDAAHDGHLVTPSESAFWHNRPEAKKIRAAAKARLKALLSRKGR